MRCFSRSGATPGLGIGLGRLRPLSPSLVFDHAIHASESEMLARSCSGKPHANSLGSSPRRRSRTSAESSGAIATIAAKSPQVKSGDGRSRKRKPRAIRSYSTAMRCSSISSTSRRIPPLSPPSPPRRKHQTYPGIRRAHATPYRQLQRGSQRRKTLRQEHRWR